MKATHVTLIVAPLVVAACARFGAAASPLAPTSVIAARWAPPPLAGGDPPVVVDSPRPRPTGPRGRSETAPVPPQPMRSARLA